MRSYGSRSGRCEQPPHCRLTAARHAGQSVHVGAYECLYWHDGISGVAAFFTHEEGGSYQAPAYRVPKAVKREMSGRLDEWWLRLA